MAIARVVTTGTKIEAILSAVRWIGDFVPCAVTTIEVIRAISVSLPTRVARTIMRPLKLRAEPTTLLPGATSIGSDSPVISELSTVVVPEMTTPSVAIRAPGFTINSSPTIRCEIGITISSPLRITVTSFSPSAKRAASALLALRFARASR